MNRCRCCEKIRLSFQPPTTNRLCRDLGSAKGSHSDTEIQVILSGVRPVRIDKEEGAAYDVASSLSHRTGPLLEETWDRAMQVLEREEAATVVFHVGFYYYTAMVLNGFDARLLE